MSQDKSTLQELVDDLKQQRDELRVQLHLAQLEAKEELEEEWKELEDKWAEIKPKLDAVRDDTVESSNNILSALKMIAEEVEDGYKRIRKHLE